MNINVTYDSGSNGTVPVRRESLTEWVDREFAHMSKQFKEGVLLIESFNPKWLERKQPCPHPAMINGKRQCAACGKEF